MNGMPAHGRSIQSQPFREGGWATQNDAASFGQFVRLVIVRFVVQRLHLDEAVHRTEVFAEMWGAGFSESRLRTQDLPIQIGRDQHVAVGDDDATDARHRQHQ